ncbi:MAG: PEP-CTERM sorting domain-containing protein [Pseudomonadota bacterium]|nr:PEP-CTERM sorting domain-containing protein [Pseudomonadota bacterium]
MKAANLNFMKRSVTSALLATSAIILTTAATDVRSAPFSISAIIHESVSGSPGCPSGLGGTITGTGISSLLGVVSLEGNDCFTLPSATQNFFTFSDGKMILTLSDGDEIFANYQGFLTPTNQPSIFTFTDSVFKITGGTGDFLNATGAGKLLGGENIQTGNGFIYATGKIFGFKTDRDDDKDKDRKKKDKNDKEKDDKEKDNNKDKDRAGAQQASVTVGLDSGLFPNSQNLGQPLGDYFYQDQNGRLLAINALPESGSLALLGIGLVSLGILRRRKLADSIH